jgi:hypothetical protein
MISGKNLVGSGRGLILRYYPGIRQEGLRKTTNNLNQDSRPPGPRISPRTFRIQGRSVNHKTTTCVTVFRDIASCSLVEIALSVLTTIPPPALLTGLPSFCLVRPTPIFELTFSRAAYSSSWWEAVSTSETSVNFYQTKKRNTLVESSSYSPPWEPETLSL